MQTEIAGNQWKAVVNGKRSINGKRHSVTLTGAIVESDANPTIYDVMHDLAEHIQNNLGELQYPDSFQITLFPHNAELSEPSAGK